MGFPGKTEHERCREQYLGRQSPRTQTGRVCELRADPKTEDEWAKPATAAGALRYAVKTHISQRMRSCCRSVCSCRTPAAARPREIRFIFFRSSTRQAQPLQLPPELQDERAQLFSAILGDRERRTHRSPRPPSTPIF